MLTIHGGVSRAAFPYGYRPPSSWFEERQKAFPELENKRLLLLPGRLSRYKGHATFLELIAALVPDYPDIHGVILGQTRTGSRYRAELEGLAQRNKVLDRVTFTGLRTDIRDWMASSEIVYNLCSDPPEAFGRTIPESLRLGIPVLAWDHGGVREVLEHMFPSGAVRPGSLHTLLEKTRSFLDLPPTVAESNDFLLSDSMTKTLALYTELLENNEGNNHQLNEEAG